MQLHRVEREVGRKRLHKIRFLIDEYTDNFQPRKFFPRARDDIRPAFRSDAAQALQRKVETDHIRAGGAAEQRIGDAGYAANLDRNRGPELKHGRAIG